MDSLKGQVTPRDWGAVAVILGIAVVIGAGYYMWLKPKQTDNLTGYERQNQEVLLQLQQARDMQANIDTLRAETAKIKQLVSDFERRLPSEREVPTLVRSFEGLANEVGLDPTLRQEKSAKDPRKETIPYTVAVTGDFHQITSFINRLERFERYVMISDLDIEGQSDGSSEAKFNLSTFRFIEQENAPAPAAGATP
jgi:type IV pilus assembly protein PilO